MNDREHLLIHDSSLIKHGEIISTRYNTEIIPTKYKSYKWLYLLALIGVFVSFLLTRAPDIKSITSYIYDIIFIDSILIPFIPIYFKYLRESNPLYYKGDIEKVAVRIEQYTAISLLLAIISLAFSNAFTSQFPFHILQILSPTQYLYIGILGTSIVFVFASIIAVLNLSENVLRYVDLTPLVGMKEYIADRFTYLPIFTETVVKLDSSFLDRPLQWYDKGGNEETLKIMLNGALDSDEKLRRHKDKLEEIVNKFLDNFPSLAKDIILSYSKIYKTLEEETSEAGREQPALIKGLICSEIGYSEYFYPNEYTVIMQNRNLLKMYNKLKAELNKNKDMKQYLSLRNNVLELKKDIDTKFKDLI